LVLRLRYVKQIVTLTAMTEDT